MKMKRVAISKLAEYAADPDGYVSRKGGVISATAAIAGTEHHDSLGKPPSRRVPILIVVLFALILFFYLLFLK